MPREKLIEDTLQDVFKRHRHKPWIFLRGLGNWGDYLLFAGAECLADRVGLNWTSMTTEEFQIFTPTPDHCVYIHGGGGYNHWSSGRAFVNLKLASERNIGLLVQGPISTGGDIEDLQPRFQKSLSAVRCHELLIFAREQHTFDTLQTLTLNNTVTKLLLDHDTAFSLQPSDLLQLAEIGELPKGRYDLVVAREDPEQPEDNNSKPHYRRKSITMDPAYMATSFRHWVRIHLFAKSIITNRLHSSIIGYIAGKPVTLSSGSYHKNRSVWLHSMQEGHAEWADSFIKPRNSVWELLPKNIRQSYKARKLHLALHSVPIS